MNLRCINCGHALENETPYDSPTWVHGWSGLKLCYPSLIATPALS